MWRDVILIVEFLAILAILVTDYLNLQVAKASHEIYITFLEERSAWYRSRNRRIKSDGGSIRGGMGDSIPDGASSISVSETIQTRQADQEEDILDTPDSTDSSTS